MPEPRQPDLFAPLYLGARVELFHQVRDGQTAWFAQAVETTPTGRPKIVDGKIALVGGLAGPFPSSEAARKAIDLRRKP
jgi:hypothetical protein